MQYRSALKNVKVGFGLGLDNELMGTNCKQNYATRTSGTQSVSNGQPVLVGIQYCYHDIDH